MIIHTGFVQMYLRVRQLMEIKRYKSTHKIRLFMTSSYTYFEKYEVLKILGN